MEKNDKDFEIIQKMLLKCHGNFKDHVLKYRDKKIISDETVRNQIFNANIFLGGRSLEIGLIDGIGDYKTVFDKKYKGVEIIKYSNEYRYLKGSKFNAFSSILNMENLKIFSNKLLKL